MSGGDGMTDLERLIEIQAIHDLKGRRDHAVDRKDWDGYAALHSDDYTAMSIGPDPIVGGRAAADALAVHLAKDNLFWSRGGEKQWLRGFGFYHETYARGTDGRWRFTYRRLERTHAETSPGAASLAMDVSGENLCVG